MKKPIFLIVFLIGVLALAACGGGNNNAPANNATMDNAPANNAPANNAPADDADQPSDSGGDADNPFPIPDGASIMMSTDIMANFQVEATLDEMIDYYRSELGGMGLTERTINTSITEGVASFVFDGHASGQAVVVQMVDLGNGSINVNIRFEDV